MTKYLVRMCGIFFAMALSANLASAAEKTLPTTVEEFEKFSAQDMKGLPDYKWPLGKSVSTADTKDKSPVELMLLRNSIYAQHGLHFTQKGVAEYFASRSWYKPNHEDDSMHSLTTKEQAAAHEFLQAQTAAAKGRGVAQDGGDESHGVRENVAYEIYSMGFCTYKGKYSDKAGVIIFEAGGVAKIYHSIGSLQNSVDAYESFKPKAGVPTRLVKGTWSIEPYGENYAKVMVTVNPGDVPKPMGAEEDYTPMLAGAREVMDTKSPGYAKRDCTMILRK